MTLEAGKYISLQVAKEVSPHGYFLTDGTQEVLLHYSEIVGVIEIGQVIEVFLFFDTQDRLASTMKRPLIQMGQPALLEVVDINQKVGSFLEMGLGRNLLLPFREQPELHELRPLVGDQIFVNLAHDRQGRMIAKLAGERELAPLTFHAPTSWMNQWLEARVYNSMEMGTFVICDGGVLGFGAIGLIHSTERIGLPRVGQVLKVRVTFVREDGKVNLSMKPLKEVGRNEDAEKILAYLKEQSNGMMPISDASPAELINQCFHITKGAFKRAIGKLMKEDLVYHKENCIYLKSPDHKFSNPTKGGADLVEVDSE